MAAISAQYPINGDPFVRGDPMYIPVTIGVEDDISAWTWRAQVRSTPDGDLAATFTITRDDHTLTLFLDGDETALLDDGMGFDVEQLTPTQRTWWIVDALRMRKDFSRDEEEEG